MKFWIDILYHQTQIQFVNKQNVLRSDCNHVLFDYLQRILKNSAFSLAKLAFFWYNMRQKLLPYFLYSHICLYFSSENDLKEVTLYGCIVFQNIYIERNADGLQLIYLALTRNNHIKDAQDFLYDLQTLKATVVNNNIHFYLFYILRKFPPRWNCNLIP